MPELIPRVKGMRLIVVQNPTHLALRELFVKRFGVERANQMQPMRSLLDAGIPLALGSDGPNNPYLNIMLASVYPGKSREAITREQAVVAYTLTDAGSVLHFKARFEHVHPETVDVIDKT